MKRFVKILLSLIIILLPLSGLIAIEPTLPSPGKGKWKITSDYGPRMLNSGWNFHKGIDYGNSGDIIPVEGGTIAGSKQGIAYDGGWFIRIVGDNGKWTYLHTFSGQGSLPQASGFWELRSASLVNPVTGKRENVKRNAIILWTGSTKKKAVKVLCDIGGKWILNPDNETYVVDAAGNKILTRNTVTSAEPIAPVGNSGDGNNVPIHLHLGLNDGTDNPLLHVKRPNSLKDTKPEVQIIAPPEGFKYSVQKPPTYSIKVDVNSKSGLDLDKVDIWIDGVKHLPLTRETPTFCYGGVIDENKSDTITSKKVLPKNKTPGDDTFIFTQKFGELGLELGWHTIEVTATDVNNNASEKVVRKFLVASEGETIIQSQKAPSDTVYNKVMTNWGQGWRYNSKKKITEFCPGKSKVGEVPELYIGKKIPMEMIDKDTEINFEIVTTKCRGGATVFYTGGALDGKQSYPSMDVCYLAVKAFDKEGNPIQGKNGDKIKPPPRLSIEKDHSVKQLWAYTDGAYKINAEWVNDGYYVYSFGGKNSRYNPVKEGKVNIYNFLNEVGISSSKVATLIVALWGQSSLGSDNAGFVGYSAAMKKVTQRYYTIGVSCSNGLDLSPPKSRTQKVAVRKKKKSVKKAPVLMVASADENDEEQEEEIIDAYPGEMIEIEGEAISDEEGGTIKGVWCLSPEGEWETVKVGIEEENGRKKGFTYSYLVPKEAEEGEYAIEVKSENNLGESDAGYGRMVYVIQGSANCSRTYIENTSSKTISITPASGEIKIEIPEGTFSDNVNITISTSVPENSDRDTVKVTGIGFEITNDKGLQPQKEISVTVSYGAGDIVGMEEDKLVIGLYDDTNNRWVAMPTIPDVNGNKVVGKINHLSKFGIIQLTSAENLSKVKIYPSPYNPAKHAQGMIIDNLTSLAEIKIYTIAGELVKEVEYNTGNGRAVWDGKNDYGRKCASGVYVAYIKSANDNKKIKFAIER